MAVCAGKNIQYQSLKRGREKVRGGSYRKSELRRASQGPASLPACGGGETEEGVPKVPLERSTTPVRGGGFYLSEQ